MEYLFIFIPEYASWASEESTEQWIAAHVDACEAYNDKENKEHWGVTCIDFYNVMPEYINWLNTN